MSDTNMGYPNDSQSYLVGPGGVTKGRAVKPGANSTTVIACAAAGDADLIRGIAYQDAAEGERVLVILHGSCDAEVATANAAIGDALTINATGQLVAQADPQVTETVAYALENSKATVAGQPPYVKVRVLTAPRVPLVVSGGT